MSAGFLTAGPVALPVNRRGIIVGLGCLVVCLIAVAAALTVGKLGITPTELPAVLAGHGSKIQSWAVFSNRLPRALTALGVGALFGMSGAVFQSVTRNPLGSPDVIGLSAGAAAGAAVVSLFFTAIPVPVGALIGGLIAVAIVVAGSGSGLAAPHRMVVIGIGVAAMSVAVVQFVLARAREQEALAIAGWIHGSLAARNWLLAGGIGVVLAAFAVVLGGPIAFIALVAPQVGKRLTRASGPGLLIAALVGAALLCLADVVAQHLLPSPVPVGIATAGVGGVYLVFLLMREWRRAST